MNNIQSNSIKYNFLIAVFIKYLFERVLRLQ
jgi:hypothetical protein